MPKTHQLHLKPIGVDLTAPAGTPLRELLFDQGAEFPCGGQGRCRGCRVKVLEGSLPVNDAMRQRLTSGELEEGWRLSCQATLDDDITLELRQWDVPVLSDDSDFAFVPGEGLGVAVDLGTTTLAAQLLDLSTGAVLAVRTALNPQARWGGDVMSRIHSALADGAEAEMREAIRAEIGGLIQALIVAAHADAARLRRVVVVGNSAMHHLFGGISVDPLSHTPFDPLEPGLITFQGPELGWDAPNAAVFFPPILGGFVGADILAGILATRLHESDGLAALVDLGTNGEIVIGNHERLLCASTAAGPAFEGARIHQGMRAATGAIWQVDIANGTPPEGRQLGDTGRMVFSVLGGGRPRGLCGSGLVDAVATGLTLGDIRPTGRLADGSHVMPLLKPVALTQADIRELQLAKGAIAAGVTLLLRRWNAAPEDLHTVYLAGAFGNYINRASARRIGLLNFPLDAIAPAGNTALLGAKMALFQSDGLGFEDLRARTEHVALHEEPGFQDVYADAMSFPPGDDSL